MSKSLYTCMLGVQWIWLSQLSFWKTANLNDPYMYYDIVDVALGDRQVITISTLVIIILDVDIIII